MSARDKDARAAMLLMLRSDLRGSNASAERTQEGTPEDARVYTLQRGLARHAWLIADAMEAERAKRQPPEAAPEPVAPCPWRFDCIDCGVGIAVDEDRCCKTCGRGCVTIKGGVPDYSSVVAGDEADAISMKRNRESIDALASENAKLRAVAEAAARLQRLRDSNRPDGIGEASLQLDGALGNWLPGWRTK